MVIHPFVPGASSSRRPPFAVCGSAMRVKNLSAGADDCVMKQNLAQLPPALLLALAKVP